ncbi:Na(+)/H(+) antiporter NhaA-like [Hydractinia symbiolongicarpus]|uniref:Na(+)/H(+) antiporter NhaA-like n=1 Tax=Hydractinia symbiolongicarpus TaxID=13093 RepID=UPI00254CBEA6|nr:Na(+)/H(+) antiporter NhaA-like [Hydractinia symbiolongicarpus]
MLTLRCRTLLVSSFKTSHVMNAKLSTAEHKNAKFPPTFITKRYQPNVAVINLEGTIQPSFGKQKFGRDGKLNIESLEGCIEKAFNINKLKAVCLIINSPGGSPSQSELISNKINNLGKEKNVNVISFVHDLALSGGYWMACAGSEIYITKNSAVGSLGAVFQGFGFHEFIKRYGIERRIYVSGENKSILDPFSPEKENDIAMMKGILKHIHKNFADYVKESRHNKLNGPEETLFNGDIFIGQKAVELGLADGINTVDKYIHEKFGTKVNVVRVNPLQKGKFSSLFGVDYSPFDIFSVDHKLKFM